MSNMKNRKVIKVEVPKEIWDADMSIWNILFGRRIMVDWMKSIVSVINLKGSNLSSKNCQNKKTHKKK